MSSAAHRRDAALRRLRSLTATTVAVALLGVGALSAVAAATKPGAAPRAHVRRIVVPPPAAPEPALSDDGAPTPAPAPAPAPQPTPAPPVVTSGGS
jgi:peptidoglycan DL-endopeptidase CwlO